MEEWRRRRGEDVGNKKKRIMKKGEGQWKGERMKRREEKERGEWDNCTEAAYRYCTVYYISTNIISDRGFTFWSFCYTTREWWITERRREEGKGKRGGKGRGKEKRKRGERGETLDWSVELQEREREYDRERAVSCALLWIDDIWEVLLEKKRNETERNWNRVILVPDSVRVVRRERDCALLLLFWQSTEI